MNTYRHTNPPGSSDAIEPNPVTLWDWTRFYLRRVLRWALPITAAGAWVWLCFQAEWNHQPKTGIGFMGLVAVVLSVMGGVSWMVQEERFSLRVVVEFLHRVLTWPWRKDRLENEV
jgi:hypothetical protein